MHSRIIYTLGEMGTWIPQLPGSSEVKKSEGIGMGRWVMGMMYVVVPLAQNRRWGMCMGGG